MMTENNKYKLKIKLNQVPKISQNHCYAFGFLKLNKMKVSLKKAFSLLDGRLSTEIGDVYLMLNYIFDENFMTHQLPTAMRKLEEVNPDWFSGGKSIIEGIKTANETNDFAELMKIIDEKFPTLEIELGKLKSDIPFLAGLV